MKTIAKTIIVGILGALMLGTPAMAQDKPHYTVSVRFACPLDVMVRDFNMLAQGGDPDIDAKCVTSNYPLTYDVLEIIAGPKKDIDGDQMFVVKIADDAYTIAWPEHNSTLPKQSSL